jgi:CHASE2 domain-containing sensor protein
LGLFQPLELNFYDRLLRVRPSEEPDSRLLVVGITEEDLRRWQYPVPNKTILELLQRLEASEPRAIGLDIIRDAAVQGQPGEREALLQFMQESGVLVAVCRVPDRLGGASGQGFPPPEGLQPEQFGAANLGVDPDNVARRAFLTLTPPSLTTGSTGANTPAPPSPCDDSTKTIPYFGLQLALNYLDAEKIQLETTPEQYIKLGDTVFQPLQPNTGPYRSPDVGGKQGYQLLINYRANRQIATQVTLTEVLEGKVGRDRIKDKVVLIGYVAESVKDDFATPFNQQRNLPPMPGVVIHAHTVSQILSTVLDQRPQFWFWQPQLEGVWILGWSVFGALLAWRFRHPFLLLGAIVVSAWSLIGISYWIFTQAGWIPVVPPLLAFLLASGIVVIFTRGVAQAIYAGVKGLLKLDIEIDQEKKDRDVAEITESSYFQELQARSEELRRQKETSESGVATSTSKEAPEPDKRKEALEPADVQKTPEEASELANFQKTSEPAKPADPLPSVSTSSPQAKPLMIDPTLPFKKRKKKPNDSEQPLPQAQVPVADNTQHSMNTEVPSDTDRSDSMVIPYRPDVDAATQRPEPIPHLNIDVDLIKLFDSEDSLPIPDISDRPVESPPPSAPPARYTPIDNLPEIAPPPSARPAVNQPKVPDPPTLPAQAIADLEDLLQPMPLEQPIPSSLPQELETDNTVVARSAIADLESLFQPRPIEDSVIPQPVVTEPVTENLVVPAQDVDSQPATNWMVTEPLAETPVLSPPVAIESVTVLPPLQPTSTTWVAPTASDSTTPTIPASPEPQTSVDSLDQLFQAIGDYYQQLKRS